MRHLRLRSSLPSRTSSALCSASSLGLPSCRCYSHPASPSSQSWLSRGLATAVMCSALSAASAFWQCSYCWYCRPASRRQACIAAWRLTIRPSRRRFAARLNSGVRPHKSPCNPYSASHLFSCFSGFCSQLLTRYPHPGVMIYYAHASQCSHTGCVNKAFSTIFFAPHMTSSMYGGGFSSSQYRHLPHWPQHSHFGGLRPNNSSKPTPLRGAA